MKNIEKLVDVRLNCLKCKKCELFNTRTNVVFGAGNPDSKIMFIGEGPGENEDLTGEPFVGRGGQLLDKMLLAIGLSRKENIYITNIVKCRPPKNRDPEPDEQDACIGYLIEQIKVIEPKIIVALGRVAAKVLIDSNFKVTVQHGCWFEKDNIFMMGTYHPAALLRFPKMKAEAFKDFLSLKQKVKDFNL